MLLGHPAKNINQNHQNHQKQFLKIRDYNKDLRTLLGILLGTHLGTVESMYALCFVTGAKNEIRINSMFFCKTWRNVQNNNT